MINPRCRSRSGADALQCFVAADVQPKAAANFAAGMALVAAIEAAASVEVGAVAASLRTLHLREFYADISFDANMLADHELSDPKLRLLETDTQIVVPVDKVIKLQLTSADVLHAWTIPAFGVKMDAVPGRLNETWFKANKEGIYYGQCSELCGPKHAFMPINVKVVSNKEFEEWIEFAKSEYASLEINYSDDTFEIAKK